MSSSSFNSATILRWANWLARPIPWLIAALVIATGVFYALSCKYGVHVNISASLPAHVFVEANRPAVVGDAVMFCPPLRSEAVNQLYYRQLLYIDANSKCQSRLVPLSKVLVALEGSMVQVTGEGLVVDGRLLPNTKPLSIDRQGRPLVSMPQGVYEVLPGQAWVVSTYNARSFDSRYFGPVDVRELTALETLF